MSKSRKDGVGGHGRGHAGREYWSRRPGSKAHGAYPCRWTKTLTHRIERRMNGRVVREEMAD